MRPWGSGGKSSAEGGSAELGEQQQEAPYDEDEDGENEGMDPLAAMMMSTAAPVPYGYHRRRRAVLPSRKIAAATVEAAAELIELLGKLPAVTV